MQGFWANPYLCVNSLELKCITRRVWLHQWYDPWVAHLILLIWSYMCASSALKLLKRRFGRKHVWHPGINTREPGGRRQHSQAGRRAAAGPQAGPCAGKKRGADIALLLTDKHKY